MARGSSVPHRPSPDSAEWTQRATQSVACGTQRCSSASAGRLCISAYDHVCLGLTRSQGQNSCRERMSLFIEPPP